MKISVVTVCLNAEGTIGRSIDSFLRQDHANKELLVIDGGSRDATLAVIRDHGSDQVRVVSARDHGIYDAMNKGLALFSGDAVGFLNADDRFASPGALSAIAEHLAEADVVYGHLDMVAGGQRERVVRAWRATSHTAGAFRRGWMPAHPTFYARRAVIEAVGRFDLRFAVAADYDFMLRAFELHHCRSQLIDRVLVKMRYGGVSTASMSAYLRSNIEALRSRRLRLGSGIVDRAVVGKPAGKIGQFMIAAWRRPHP